ncbi:hypothetical protein MMC25_003557 [Agyrium rufum]|nr:hypothetical protein [Agyrium rufum]
MSFASLLGLYASLLALLTRPIFQSHAVYLHAVQLTWFKDLNVPEIWGFPKNQVTPFEITTPDGNNLYAWHVLPIELYRKHELDLVAEPTGFTSDIRSRVGFQLLRDDPEARLILHFHGAGGTVGSGYRVNNYRALSAGQPNKIHVLTFDCRGFGRSPGMPSQSGLTTDGLAVVDWAINVAGIPPSRILIFGQSMRTAVSVAISEYSALRSDPVVFAGTILVAPFVDVPTLVSIYRIMGAIPLLSPLKRFPALFNYPHTPTLFWYAVNATIPTGISRSELEVKKIDRKIDLGAAGTIIEWNTELGNIREEILKTGLHDVIMGYPVITMAVMRAFESADVGSH